MHQSSQMVLAHVLRAFLERLLRQAYSAKLDTDQSRFERKNVKIIFLLFAFFLLRSLDNIIRPEHICQAIKTIAEFDFLSNKHLGVAAFNDRTN